METSDLSPSFKHLLIPIAAAVAVAQQLPQEP